MTAVAPIAVALTIVALTGSARADARKPAPAWVCVERPIEGIDVPERPLFVFIGPRVDAVRPRGLLGEGKKICADVLAGPVVVDVRISSDETKAASEPCATPLRLRLAAEVFLHVSVVRSPPTPSRQCPWTTLYSIDDPTVPRKNDLMDVDFVILPAVTSYERGAKARREHRGPPGPQARSASRVAGRSRSPDIFQSRLRRE